MLDECRTLSPLMHQHLVRLIEDIRAKQGPTDVGNRAKAALGVTPGAFSRAGLYFTRHVSSADADIENGAANAFLLSWCLGEREAMRMIMAAITSPGAKGREVEVVEALMKGASIEEALAKRDSAPITQSGSVVAFPPRGVTTAREPE